MSNHILVGPVLGFRGLQEGRWNTSALVVLQGNDHPPQLIISVAGELPEEAKAILLKTYAGCQVWRLEWSVAQTAQQQTVAYSIDGGQPFRYVVPEQNKSLRICYGSCFGVHHQQDLNKVQNRNTMWKVLLKVHQQRPYHLFILGGDQVYADQVWETVQPLKDWLGKPLKKRVQAPFTADMEQQVAQFYFGLYCQMWRQKKAAAILSQVPTLMMWDDHDIFDGWGSYSPEQQDSAVFAGIYAQAREHFRLFQLQAKDDDDLGEGALHARHSFTYAHRIGDLALVALDLRSERSQNQVMSPETWNRVQHWMEEALTEKHMAGSRQGQSCRHLLVLSGIPIVNANLTLLEAVLEISPGIQRIEDDLKDQWLSRAHQQERLRFIHLLFGFSKQSGCRVTLVSGDAHMAFWGYLQAARDPGSSRETQVINQLTSSAMVNLPPPALVIYMMEKILGEKVEEVDSGITARLLKFPGTSRYIIGARNWLSLTLDDRLSIGVEWYVEGETKPYAQFIHPVSSPLG
jgi:hypothetical protein